MCEIEHVFGFPPAPRRGGPKKNWGPVKKFFQSRRLKYFSPIAGPKTFPIVTNRTNPTYTVGVYDTIVVGDRISWKRNDTRMYGHVKQVRGGFYVAISDGLRFALRARDITKECADEHGERAGPGHDV